MYQSRNDSVVGKPFKWTITHSHFLQMGGYIFKSRDTLYYIDMKTLFIDKPIVKDMNIANMRRALLQRQDLEEELMDRSKTNGLTQIVVYGQMLWFGVSFIGKLVGGLTITKLEAASLAYVVTTLLTYYFWMHKPLDVECPIVVTEAVEGDFGDFDNSLSLMGSLSEKLGSSRSYEMGTICMFNQLDSN